MALRVVLAEDNYLVREGIVALLAEASDIDIVTSVGDLPSLITAVDRYAPDAVLTDIRMPPTHTTEGIQAARQIRAAQPSVGVVVLSQYAEEDYALELLGDGVAYLGYLLKERITDVTELSRALHTVAAGGSVIDPKVVESLVARKVRTARSPLRLLTEREREVVQQMAEGKNNAAIARSLFLGERAIEKHINALFSKLGLSEEADTHRRVMAVLTFLHEKDAGL
jgi:DNA-binding NarL/FixJ family response regulator